MTDAAFLAAFEACSLSGRDFDHRSHVRAAYLYLRRDGYAGAVASMTRSLKRFTAAHGQASRYHATITLAYLTLINERLVLRGDGGGWEGFAAANADLFDRDLLARYYKPETLKSERARQVFVLGDALTDRRLDPTA
ncbi:MAG: hypothetical protein MI920_23510 [Kiloniellales bacterium]|nr:hypothetical protein [Kiloniellales bacterium]